MASLGHLAVGMAAARASREGTRPTWREAALWAAWSMLPDADVIAFSLGIDYAAPWGHRGATHSLIVAFAGGALGAVVAPALRLPRVRLWILSTLVLASHGLLDTLTTGGLGCALLWPFDLTRYFAPWRPIPVAPIGLAFLSPYGAFVAFAELVLFAPLLVYAWRRHDRPRRAGARVVGWTAWLAVVWLFASTDPLRQRVVATLLREDTEYAAMFSERAFAAVATRMSGTEVERLLGPPLEQWWHYSNDSDRDCRLVRLAPEGVTRWRNFDACTPARIHPAMTAADVRTILGVPPAACWAYSRSRNGAMFQARTICFEGDRVSDVLTGLAPADP
jgi:inner membrane protein